MKKYLIAAAVATMIAPAAQALTIVDSQTRSIGFAPTELDTVFSFDGYTGSETIDYVNVTFGGAIDGSGTLLNTGANTQTAEGTTTSEFTFTSDQVNLGAVPQTTVSGSTGAQEIEAETTETFNVDGSSSGSFQPTGGDISAYLSAFDISLQTLTGINGSGGGGNVLFGQSTDAFADITVEYGVTPIPLPAAAWMLLAGLGSLLAFRRYGKA